jgi:hypothetical protein
MVTGFTAQTARTVSTISLTSAIGIYRDAGAMGAGSAR